MRYFFNFSVYLVCFGVLPSAAAFAVTTQAHGFLITAEPIVGYELNYRTNPTPRTKGMLIYGARFTAGRPHIAAEGEYTRGTDSEGFTTPAVQTVNTTKENARLGVRGTYEVSKFLGVYLRMGGQASRMKVENLAVGGTTTASDGKWEIRPYAGLGGQGNIATKISVSLEANYVFNSLEVWSQNTVQFTGGVRIHL
jgi:hypothetical protein